MTNDKKFDIFDILNKISKKDISFFDSLEEWQIRQIYPLILMKWMAGAKNKNQIKMVNDLVNIPIFSLYKHPKLLYKMLMVCDNKTRPAWVKRPSKVKDDIVLKVIKEYNDCTFTEAKKYLPLFSNEDIIEMAESIGSDKETIKKLKTELNGK